MPEWHKSTRRRLRSSIFQILAQAGFLRDTRSLKLQTAPDPNDGVKVNYGKFGGLLAEVKSVTGGTDEDTCPSRSQAIDRSAPAGPGINRIRLAVRPPQSRTVHPA